MWKRAIITAGIASGRRKREQDDRLRHLGRGCKCEAGSRPSWINSDRRPGFSVCCSPF
jgi:hypothetical protein